MDTMNLNESNDDGMVPLDLPTPQKVPEKNIQKQQQMDSTPLTDVLPSAPLDQQQEGPVMYGQQLPQSAMQQQQQQMMMQQQQQQQHFMQQQAGSGKKANPLNLTDEQFQALVAGVCAMIAFSKPVQEKLMSFFPQFVSEGGMTMAGLVVSGLIVSIIYYIIDKFVLNR